MIVMPPIEWPTSTTRPPAGMVAASTAPRSAPSCSMVECSGSPRPDRPWPRWSQNTSRVAGQRLALVVPDVLAQRVPVAEDDRHRRVVRPADLDVQRHAVVGQHGQRPVRGAGPAARPRPGRAAAEPADRDLLGGRATPALAATAPTASPPALVSCSHLAIEPSRPRPDPPPGPGPDVTPGSVRGTWPVNRVTIS